MEENKEPIEEKNTDDVQKEGVVDNFIDAPNLDNAPKPPAETPAEIPQEEPPAPEPAPAPPAEEILKHVLPPKKYKLKTMLMFSDFFLAVLCVYILMIRSIISDISNETFSFASNRMFAIYCVLAITAVLLALVFIFKFTKSVKTRFERSNEVRQNQNIKIWLTGFDWGWPILFLPTFLLMAVAGLFGILINEIFGAAPVTQGVIGGIVIAFGALNAAVVIFKLKPVILGLIVGAIFIILMILLLHGPPTLLAFFKGFRHIGINVEPVGYLMLAYIWSLFLRIIWLRSLFFYWVFVPNRLELQHGLSESNDSVDRDDLRHKIDTDDVILRWCNVGIITFYFPELDRLPITNVVWSIRKKAAYANKIASVKTMQD